MTVNFHIKELFWNELLYINVELCRLVWNYHQNGKVARNYCELELN